MYKYDKKHINYRWKYFTKSWAVKFAVILWFVVCWVFDREVCCFGDLDVFDFVWVCNICFKDVVV